jgi:hypothetical protein
VKARIPRHSVVIYGLFCKSSGDCVYVGQTIDPTVREIQHNHYKDGRGIGCDFRIIKYVEPHNANHEESLLISEYKSIGQARLNKQLKPHSTTKPMNNDYSIIWKDGNLEFRGFSEAGRYFKCCAQTISNALRYRKGMLKPGIILTKIEIDRANGKLGGRPRKNREEGREEE